jgi:hypothetical protein
MTDDGAPKKKTLYGFPKLIEDAKARDNNKLYNENYGFMGLINKISVRENDDWP